MTQRWCAFFLVLSPFASAQRFEEEVPLMRPDEREAVEAQSETFNRSLEPALAEAAKSTVLIWGSRGRKPIEVAYGTVIGNGRQVLTKWSQIQPYLDTLYVQGGNGDSAKAEVSGVYTEEDLALLDIETDIVVTQSRQPRPRIVPPPNASGDRSGSGYSNGGGIRKETTDSLSPKFVPAKFHVRDLSLGDFLAASRPNGKPGAFGIVSVLERNLRETDQAHLGIMADAAYRGEGVRIASVQPEYGAAAAGIQAGDVILKLGERTISGLQELKNAMSGKYPGDKVKLFIESAGKERSVEVMLSNRPMLGQFSGDRLNQMERMGGEPNRVRDGFSRVVQSDMQIQANKVGGPVADLSGNIVGITMARADRTRTYIMGSGALVDLLKQKADTVSEALAKTEEKKMQLAEQRRALLPKIREHQAKPRDPERMRRHLSDVERLNERLDRELELLGSR